MPTLVLTPKTAASLGALDQGGLATPPIITYGSGSYGDNTYGIVNSSPNTLDLTAGTSGTLILTPNS